MVFSKRLKELRELKQISMMTLAKEIGVSDAAICKWENNQTEPKASNLLSLSEYFEVSTDFLLGLENDYGIKKYPDSFIIPKENLTISNEMQEIFEILKDLPAAPRAQLLGYAQGLANRINFNKNKKLN